MMFEPKELEWVVLVTEPSIWLFVNTIFGKFEAYKGLGTGKGYWRLVSNNKDYRIGEYISVFDQELPTLDEAKLAAQSHYNALIASGCNEVKPVLVGPPEVKLERWVSITMEEAIKHFFKWAKDKENANEDD